MCKCVYRLAANAVQCKLSFAMLARAVRVLMLKCLFFFVLGDDKIKKKEKLREHLENVSVLLFARLLFFLFFFDLSTIVKTKLRGNENGSNIRVVSLFLETFTKLKNYRDVCMP